MSGGREQKARSICSNFAGVKCSGKATEEATQKKVEISRAFQGDGGSLRQAEGAENSGRGSSEKKKEREKHQGGAVLR